MKNSFKELFKKIVNGKNITENNLLDFVEYSYKINNPDKPYDKAVTVKAFNTGFREQILNYYYNDIKQDPNKYGVQINKLIDENNNLLKIDIL